MTDESATVDEEAFEKHLKEFTRLIKQNPAAAYMTTTVAIKTGADKSYEAWSENYKVLKSISKLDIEQKERLQFQAMLRSLVKFRDDLTFLTKMISLLAIATDTASAADISRLLGVSQSTVSRWVSEEKKKDENFWNYDD